jgi:hypothetical protein
MSRWSCICLLLSVACQPLTNNDHGDHGYDDHSNVLSQGVYDCAERDDTGYTQGDSFSITVVTVDDRPVEQHTANAYIAMQAAAAEDGVAVRIASGFRTMAQQEYFYGCYINCNCNNCNLAARPGYSNHQSGHALDLNTSDAGVYDWLTERGGSFGFSRTVSSEPWHWEWWGDNSDYPGPCGEPPPPTACDSGTFVGTFCDDDDSTSANAHECLAVDLNVDFHCDDVAGQPAYCGTRIATRAEAIDVLLRAGGAPLVDGAGVAFPNAFDDDDGQPQEPAINAARAYGIVFGDGARAVTPAGIATRSMMAVVLSRAYALPEATQDYFSDDNGSSVEAFHNRVAAAGLSSGCGGGRYCGDANADRSALARFACGASTFTAVPVWAVAEPPPPPPDEEPTPDPLPPPVVPEEPPPPPLPAEPETSLPEDEIQPRVIVIDNEEEPSCRSGVVGVPLVVAGLLRRRRRS